MIGLPDSTKGATKGHVVVSSPWAGSYEHPSHAFEPRRSLGIPYLLKSMTHFNILLDMCHVYANFWVVDLWVWLPDGLKSKDWASMLYSLRLKSSTPSWSIVFPLQPWPCLHSRWVFGLYLFRGERVQHWQLNQTLLDTCTTLRWSEGYLEWVTM